MKHRRHLISLLIVLCLTLSGLPARCGQMSSHVFTAIRSKGSLTGSAAKCVTDNEPFYLAGAQGPDIVGVVMPGLDSLSAFNSVGEETHYSEKKAELAMNILDGARNDKERAFAIGWISHYINDINVHALVNDYGGYYKKDPDHHKVLEQIETKHAMAAHPDIVTKERSEQDMATLGATFGEFIFDAYHTTYPDNDLYTNDQWFIKNRPYFCDRFIEAAGWCTDASKQFYDTHIKKDKKGVHSWAWSTLKFPNMPSYDDYDAYFNALETGDVEVGKEKLVVPVKVNANKLYGRFLADWELAADAAVEQTKKTYALLSAYLDETDAAKKADLRAQLLKAIPNQNLDQPKDDFKPESVFPGNKPYRKLHYTCTFRPLQNPDKLVEVQGTTADMKVEGTSYAGSENGRLTLAIDVPPDVYPYTYDLRVALSSNDAFAVPRYMGCDWIQVTGSAGDSGRVKVNVGEIFDVSIRLTNDLLTLPGQRVWIVMDEDPSSSAKHLAGKIKNSSTSWGLDKTSVGKLPGNKEFFPELGSHRYDVEVLEESVRSGDLVTKLQITDAFSKKNLGEKSLVLVFQDREQASSMQYTQAMQRWQAANNKAKPIWNLIDSKIESLTEAQRSTIRRRLEAQVAEMEKQGLSEEQIEKAMRGKMLDEMKALGLTLTPEQLAALDDYQAADAALEQVGTSYRCAFGRIILQPVEIALTMPAGWTETPQDEHAEVMRRTLKKEVSTDPSGGFVRASAEGSITITCTNDAKVEAQFLEDHEDDSWKRSAVQAPPFAGIQFSKTSVSEGEGMQGLYSYTSGECLLKHGAVYLKASYNVSVRGNRRTNDKGEVIEDGVPAARSLIDSLRAEVGEMIDSLKLAAKAK